MARGGGAGHEGFFGEGVDGEDFELPRWFDHGGDGVFVEEIDPPLAELGSRTPPLMAIFQHHPLLLASRRTSLELTRSSRSLIDRRMPGGNSRLSRTRRPLRLPGRRAAGPKLRMIVIDDGEDQPMPNRGRGASDQPSCRTFHNSLPLAGS